MKKQLVALFALLIGIQSASLYPTTSPLWHKCNSNADCTTKAMGNDESGKPYKGYQCDKGIRKGSGGYCRLWCGRGYRYNEELCGKQKGNQDCNQAAWSGYCETDGEIAAQLKEHTTPKKVSKPKTVSKPKKVKKVSKPKTVSKPKHHKHHRW